MDRYDPLKPPDPEAWLALDEGERIALAEACHEAAGVLLPSVRAHAAFHAVVETQIAMRLPPVTGAMARLMAEGLDRHEAVHAVASVLTAHMHYLVTTRPTTGDPNDKYYAELDALTVESWHRDFGDATPRGSQGRTDRRGARLLGTSLAALWGGRYNPRLSRRARRREH